MCVYLQTIMNEISEVELMFEKKIFMIVLYFHFCCCVMTHNDAGSYYKTTDTKRENMRGY